MNEQVIDTGAISQLFEGQDLYILRQNSAPTGVPFIGSNTNGVVVVHNSPSPLPVADHEQLNKILAALKLNPAEIALVNIADVPAPVFSTLVRQLGGTHLIVFGATPADMSLMVAAKRYVELNMHNKRILFSDSLEMLQQDPPRKRYLWDCLQVMFGLK